MIPRTRFAGLSFVGETENVYSSFLLEVDSPNVVSRLVVSSRNLL